MTLKIIYFVTLLVKSKLYKFLVPFSDEMFTTEVFQQITKTH